MPRRPAVVTETDIVRAIRAAKRAGASSVHVRPDGTIVIGLTAEASEPVPEMPPVADEDMLVL